MDKIILTGTPASPGVAEGLVKIISGSQDTNNFNKGDILVTKITDPSMIMIMSMAAAIVCDIGGVTSHPSIASREMGIPCVVNTKAATSVLTTGMRVKVNGNNGEIYGLD